MRISAPFPRNRERTGLKLPGSLKQRWLLLPLILVVIVERLSGLGDFIYGDHRG